MKRLDLGSNIKKELALFPLLEFIALRISALIWSASSSLIVKLPSWFLACKLANLFLSTPNREAISSFNLVTSPASVDFESWFKLENKGLIKTIKFYEK